MALEQCIGPEFEVDDGGELLLRLAGAPAGAALAATGNGLRVDPDKGAWAPAEHRAVQVSASRNDAPGNKVVNPGSQRLSGKLFETITNPSPTRSLLALVVVTFKAVFNIAPDEGYAYTGWVVLGGLDVGNAAEDPVAMNELLVGRDQGATDETPVKKQATWTTHVLVGPGESTLLRAQMGLKAIEDGYVRYVGSWMTAHGLAVTL